MSGVFWTLQALALPWWLMMMAAPGWIWTRRLMAKPWGVGILAGLYVLLLLPRLPAVLPALAPPTLASVQAMLGTPAGATLAWAHMLALDLWAGQWIYADARLRRWSHPALAAVLAATFLFGPLGLLAYLLLRRRQPAVT